MSSVVYTFKSIGNVTQLLTINDPTTESLNNYEEDIRNAFEFDKTKITTIKYIQSGKVLELDKSICNIASPHAPIVVMGSKKHVLKKQPSTSTKTITNSQDKSTTEHDKSTTEQDNSSSSQDIEDNSTNFQNVQQNSTNEQNNLVTEQNNQTYTVDQIHASLPVFMMYIAANPQLIQMYITNPEQFLNVISNQAFKPIVSTIMQQNSQIMTAIQTGGDISIGLPAIEMPNADETVENEESKVELEDNLVTENELNQNNVCQTMVETMINNLTEEDENNIKVMIELGFSRENSIEAYEVSNKTLDLAVEYLFNNL